MKFEKRWFEIISEADSPVQIERDSGRLYMAESFKSPADVMIKVHNLKVIQKSFSAPLSSLMHAQSSVGARAPVQGPRMCGRGLRPCCQCR
ncbi:hypothetical protein SKAU_G00215210 [Synaphobranchus kaupii]|uniref:Uncharacterized protein n=1 Tax=Synaphobranchus kaupii TaxID=118154 RepID=A0A9Q1F9P0_SYNKA|nr:hypothetical protein SKAU_G00215210 [Synaphobranchus kaupii]